jgi:hypothetical protein
MRFPCARSIPTPHPSYFLVFAIISQRKTQVGTVVTVPLLWVDDFEMC